MSHIHAQETIKAFSEVCATYMEGLITLSSLAFKLNAIDVEICTALVLEPESLEISDLAARISRLWPFTKVTADNTTVLAKPSKKVVVLVLQEIEHLEDECIDLNAVEIATRFVVLNVMNA